MKLEFGTAGIRGIVGDGIDKLNEIHAAKIFDGYANFLKHKYNNQKIVIVIGRDNRIKGEEFTNLAVDILTSYGIKVYFNDQMLATPFISFLVRFKKAQGAINVTASHNPKEYNGIKLYDEFGCQILPNEVKELKTFFGDYDDYLDFKKYQNLRNNKLIAQIQKEDYDAYNKRIESIVDGIDLKNVGFVYSPLHGTGYPILKDIFKAINTKVEYESNEIVEDPNFSFVANPNPEYKDAFKNSIKLADEKNINLILVTDPDSDRVGIATKHNGEWVLINGNEGAILITNFLIEKNKGNLEYSYLIYSFVSSSLPAKMCKENGIETHITETGFKWIGDKINKLSSKKFFFAFEESYGSLILDDVARDKDAIQSVVAILAIAKECQDKNISLIDKLESIYQRYGYMEAKSFSYDLDSSAQLENVKKKFSELKFVDVDFYDYNKGIRGIEKNDMLAYEFKNSSTWVSLRPSGTEPKFKIYIHVIEDSKLLAKEKFDWLKNKLDQIVE